MKIKNIQHVQYFPRAKCKLDFISDKKNIDEHTTLGGLPIQATYEYMYAFTSELRISSN